MKQMCMLFLILTSHLFAQWQIDNSFPSPPANTRYENIFYIPPDTLIVIEHYVYSPPPDEKISIYVKNITDTSWSMIYNDYPVGNIFYKDSKLAFAVSSNCKKSVDGGITWQTMYDFRNEYPNGDAYDVYFTDEQNGYVTGTTGGSVPDIHGFFGKTLNGGASWTLQTIPATETCHNILPINDSTIIMTGFYNGYDKIYKSTDNGSSWIIKNSNSINWIYKLYFQDEENGWALGPGGKIMKTTDAGESWLDVSPGSDDDYKDCIFFTKNIGWVVGTRNGYHHRPVIWTSDGGVTWENSLNVPDIIHTIFINPDSGYIMTEHQVYKTTNGGGFPTMVETQEDGLMEFKLYQNYPNPFNPTTNIKYSINSNQFVSLKVYDVLGNEVATLVNKEQPAGNYSVEFKGSNLASGIYFYQLKAGDFTAIKKLILLK